MKTTLKKPLIAIGILVLIFAALVLAIRVIGKSQTEDMQKETFVETTTETTTELAGSYAKGKYDISNYLDVNSSQAIKFDQAGDFCEFIKRTLAAGNYEELIGYVNISYLNSSGYSINEDGIKEGFTSIYNPASQSLYLINYVEFENMGDDFPDGQIAIVVGSNNGSIDSGTVDYSQRYTLYFQYFTNKDGNISSFILRDWIEGNMGAKRL